MKRMDLAVRPTQLPTSPAAPSRPLVLEDGRPTEVILAEQRRLMLDVRHMAARLYEQFSRLAQTMDRWTNNDFELVRRRDELQMPMPAPRPAVFSIPLAQANSQPQMRPAGRMSLPNMPPLPERAQPTNHPLWRERQS